MRTKIPPPPLVLAPIPEVCAPTPEQVAEAHGVRRAQACFLAGAGTQRYSRLRNVLSASSPTLKDIHDAADEILAAGEVRAVDASPRKRVRIEKSDA